VVMVVMEMLGEMWWCDTGAEREAVRAMAA
jgi:hypothetical protein